MFGFFAALFFGLAFFLHGLGIDHAWIGWTSFALVGLFCLAAGGAMVVVQGWRSK